MTLVILCRQIDISIGSIFSICGVVAGLLAQAGLPIALVGLWDALGRQWPGGDQRRPGRSAGLAVDRGHPGHPRDRTRVAPLRARGRVRPQSAGWVPVVRGRTGGRSMAGRGDRAFGLCVVCLGFASPCGGQGRIRHRARTPRRRGWRASGPAASSSGSSSSWGVWRGWPPS